MYRQSKEYLGLAEERRLMTSFGRKNYQEYKWAEGVLQKINKQGFTYYQDFYDLERAREIGQRLQYKYAKKPAQGETRENHTTTHYIWRSKDDEKVRSHHAEFDDKIFSWDEPPAGGKHPGEDYGCRCWAEPYYGVVAKDRMEEDREITVENAVGDNPISWNTALYTNHYGFGKGKSVTLRETGNLQNIIDYTTKHKQPKGGTVVERFSRDIFKEARERGEGIYPLGFNANYDISSVATSFRIVVIGGKSTITVIDKDEFLIIKADIGYYFYDRYTDPKDWRHHFNDKRGMDEINDDYGDPYDITDNWSGKLEAKIKKDSRESLYPNDEFGE